MLLFISTSEKLILTRTKVFLYVQHAQFTHGPNWFRFKFYCNFILIPCLIIDYTISEKSVTKTSVPIHFIDGKCIWFFASIAFDSHRTFPIMLLYPRLTQITETLQQRFIQMMPCNDFATPYSIDSCNFFHCFGCWRLLFVVVFGLEFIVTCQIIQSIWVNLLLHKLLSKMFLLSGKISKWNGNEYLSVGKRIIFYFDCEQIFIRKIFHIIWNEFHMAEDFNSFLTRNQ